MTKILVLGAGFGGLELCTLLSEALGDLIEVRLIDKNDHFVFGFSKLDIMIGHAKPQAVRLPYANFTKSGVQLTQESITKIDPVAKRVTTNAGSYTADYLVVALGADYDWDATPGLAEVNDILYGGGGREAPRRTIKFYAGPCVDRSVRRALQMSAGPQRMCIDASRLSGTQGR
jgi:sulfide:quinone oxidoreductase